MSKLISNLVTAALAAGSTFSPVAVEAAPTSYTEVGYIKLDREITLRRMVVHSAAPKGVVLFLHGFPETIYAWEGAAAALAGDYEVHAFDWPGFGLSSRPTGGKFTYSPSDYSRVLRQYVEKARIDRTKLVIYATDIGGLPVLLATLDEPGIAKSIIVGDFAPLDRPQYMQERLQALKTAATAEPVRQQFETTRDEILENAMRRGFKPEEQFKISATFKSDMAKGWNNGAITSANAFARYYSQFTHDQDRFEQNISRLQTPVKIVWGERDVYINHGMGRELASLINADYKLHAGIGHYPHLQAPAIVAEEIRAAFEPNPAQH